MHANVEGNAGQDPEQQILRLHTEMAGLRLALDQANARADNAVALSNALQDRLAAAKPPKTGTLHLNDAAEALRRAIQDMRAIGVEVPESGSLVGYFANRLYAISSASSAPAVEVAEKSLQTIGVATGLLKYKDDGADITINRQSTYVTVMRFARALLARAATVAEPVDLQPLTRFVTYLSEHCIGQTVSEDALEEWLADLLDATPRNESSNPPKSKGLFASAQQQSEPVEDERTPEDDLNATEGVLDAALCDMPEGFRTDYPTVSAYAFAIWQGYQRLLEEARAAQSGQRAGVAKEWNSIPGDVFYRALRAALKRYRKANPSRYLNDDQVDADDSEFASALTDKHMEIAAAPTQQQEAQHG